VQRLGDGRAEIVHGYDEGAGGWPAAGQVSRGAG
jgi:hypothetical protein